MQHVLQNHSTNHQSKNKTSTKSELGKRCACVQFESVRVSADIIKINNDDETFDHYAITCRFNLIWKPANQTHTHLIYTWKSYNLII